MAITYGQNSTNEFSHKNNEGVLQEAVDGPNMPPEGLCCKIWELHFEDFGL